ncbi:SDR family NAD(P)-dependent oxidoreductase [Spirochaeta africana]|uniref:Short-chain alcohol dehydrogenase n=1 Tax=Spirochaeta africana (strain ATCC 700263 / DSM 8902 / Z-7692) TaxID=889378 RepID=H9UJV6_SPIAZ|nr:SDR family NAD(P)-dependent oxidoreductase [Spirochaeta africana]AFG37799.1 short-chain alcohol dehydrogenase [Spirochaeta africana DSM 8902]
MKHKNRLSKRICRSLPATVWIVTGSSRGIGRVVAEMLLHNGASVVLHGRNPERLEQTRRELSQRYDETRLAALAGDIGNPDTAVELTVLAASRFGRLDGLVANAGISMRGRFLELAPEVMDTVVRTNLLGTAYTLQAALTLLQEYRGRAVVISSLAGLRGFPNVSIYSAARMALSGLVEAVRAELQPESPRPVLISLGFTENDPDKHILDAGGTAVRHQRSADATQQEAAVAILTAAFGRKGHYVTTAKGRLFAAANRWLPGLVGRLLQRSSGRIHGG